MRLPLLLLGTVAVNVCLSGGALAQAQGGGDAQPDAYTYKRVHGKEMKAYSSSHRTANTASRGQQCWCFTAGPGITVRRHGPSGRLATSRRWGGRDLGGRSA